ncbi:MAG: coenzyme F420-0:L-glutamate ligase [Oscillospiraceae bacterium]|nr:coenzyme F420-0:L-glutamate ligase [Oscillospiraceae bacterium]
MRTIGTTARGIHAPLIQRGDDLAHIVADCVSVAAREENFQLHDRDVVGVTEAVVARAQGNYANCEQIAGDICAKFPDGVLAAVFPILSRNRFGNILKGIAKGCEKLYVVLSYPADEVGNELIPWEALDKSGVNPYTDVLSEQKYREIFGYKNRHIYTNMDYVEYYKSLGSHIEILFANDARKILEYTKNILCCDVHTRFRSKRLLREAGAETVFGLDEILTSPVDGSGYNEKYGVLGSNTATENSIKLFPRDCRAIVDKIAKLLYKKTGKKIEVMIYGDGAFKDPTGRIWELADPVVSPAFTPGLEGVPNEVKLKYLLDNDFQGKSDGELKEALLTALNAADKSGRKSLGTTPRKYTDLLGSLCDLISGSGEKGTPIVLVQGYFDNYSSLGANNNN